MISDAPVQAASTVQTLSEQVRAYTAVARLKASDGLTVAELAELIVAAMRLAIKTVDSIPVDGAERKAMVIDLVAALFDEFAGRAVPLVVWPAWVFARPIARSLVLAAASGAVEALLPVVRVAA